MVSQLCDHLQTSPSSAVALGRLLVGSVLVASQLKEDQAISFQVSGRESIKKIFAHAQYDGLCRAYIDEKQAPLSVKNNNLSLEAVIGGGQLQANLYGPKSEKPHTTHLQLVNGEIGEDLAYYLNQSCQIPCLLSLALKIGKESQVLKAGGVLIELMPGHTEKTLQVLEAQQEKAQPLSQMMENTGDFEAWLQNYLGPLKAKEILSLIHI